MTFADLSSASRLATAALFLTAAFASTQSRAQNSKWAPTRAATAGTSEATVDYATPAMHSSAVRSTQTADASYRPDWQQSPAAPTTTNRSPAAARSKPAPATQSQATHFHSVPSRAPAGRSNFTGRSDARQVAHQAGSQSGTQTLTDYNIRLADGEKLVGPPKITEGGPIGSGSNANGIIQAPAPRSATSRAQVPGTIRGEVVPVPDSVSGNQGKFSGPIYNEDGTEYHGDLTQDGSQYLQGDIHLDPDYEGAQGQGDRSSCVSGNCAAGNCGSGTCSQDEWGDPSRCPECGLYGHHRIGCGQVARCLQNCLGFLFREASVFGGTQGFKGPLDLGINGNFGFNEGFNLAGAIVPYPKCGIGYQFGARWAQSDLSGNIFGSSAREQVFVTGAIFHRAYRGCGLQWGVAYDWTTDNFYTKATYAQVRLETSWLTGRGHEFGFWGVFGTKSDEVSFTIFNMVANQTITPSDMYNFFYRYTTKYGGQGRFWGGFTSQNLTIIGSDFRVPMSNRTDLVGGFNYIMPPAGQQGNGTAAESWGLSMNIVWYFGRAREGIHNTPYRPLFQVADNNVMMLERP
ncbi:MAG: hypothetical protein K8U03_05240 [Planctomycetia bacterium]|nr:hypothetical protein [Planctomycetia bacterium]